MKGFCMNFQSIKINKLSTQIADQIRSAILAGEYTPGDKLPTERELAEMFSVSRPSVREALNVLSTAGLIVSHQGGGTVVLSLLETADPNPFSELIRIEKERALDVIEVRKGIESWTAYYAAQRALPEDIRRLEDVVSAMRHKLGELVSSEELDVEFHISVSRATHNFVWLHLMQTLYNGMKSFQHLVWRSVNLTGDDHSLLYQHHLGIFEAIRAREPVTARTAMLDHLTFAEQRSSAYVGMNHL
jgi:GntR family transcriptional regulator, transcriptional repressor for pyruvate dehydrogenase complex